MSISIIQTATGTAASNAGVYANFGSPVTAGSLIYVAVSGVGSGGSGFHVYDSVNGLTNYYSAIDAQSQSNYCLNTYCFPNSASGVYTVNAAYLGGVQSALAIVIYEIAGLVTSSPIDQHTNSGALQNFTPVASGTMTTTTNAADIILSACSAYTIGSTYTDTLAGTPVISKVSGSFGSVAVNDSIVSSVGAYSDTWTVGSPGEYFYVSICALKGAGGSPPASVNLRTLLGAGI